MLNNRATIYSNGIADFQRIYKIKGDQANKISIPVRQQHLGDVLASLTISGPVTIDSPPSYQPSNQDDGNISISPHDTLISLAIQLAGSEVEIISSGPALKGKLVGVHEQEIATNGDKVKEKSLVILTENGISRIEVRRIENLKFLDETIQSEINKALSRSLREIKPNSTFVDLVLSTKDSTADAIIQYTIPAAAWKISYRILLTNEGPIKFHGHAIVDNNTDEDWKDFVISVVMGQPISFTTDLAHSKTPGRSHVNIVQDSAYGAVEVESAAASFQDSDSITMAGGAASAFSAPMMLKQKAQKFVYADKVLERTRSASIDQAEIEDTGDFCIFQSASPVSIEANHSAIIPVFVTTLDESKPVLHFKSENHSERPFRALRFKNTTEHSLGRGVCTIYDQTTYAGNCILPATKPGADALLPHALETSVRVNVKQNQTQTRRIGIRISEGVAYESYHQLLKTEYTIQNGRTDAFDFLLDHPLRWHNCAVEITLHRKNAEPVSIAPEELKQGKRIEFLLGDSEVVKVIHTETNVRSSKVGLIGSAYDESEANVSWLYDNIVVSNSSLANDPAVTKCIEIKSQLEDKENEIRDANNEIERLSQRQTRLRENIKTGSHDQQTTKWQTNLAKSEDAIVKLEDERLPKLKTELDSIRKTLFESVKGLALEWAEQKK